MLSLVNNLKHFLTLVDTFYDTPCYVTIPQFWPDGEAPDFRDAMCDLFESCVPLHLRVLEVMGRGLKLEVRLWLCDLFECCVPLHQRVLEVMGRGLKLVVRIYHRYLNMR